MSEGLDRLRELCDEARRIVPHPGLEEKLEIAMRHGRENPDFLPHIIRGFEQQIADRTGR